MTRSRSFARGSELFRRRPPRIPPSGKSFLIVTEGERTEPSYFRSLRDRIRLSATDVEIVHPPGTDPLTLVERAIELKNRRKAEAKKSSWVVEYDEVWVVFDLEKINGKRRDQARQAKEKGGRHGILFADSDPCFEYWLLLHEIYTTAMLEDCDKVVRLLKKHINNYKKGMSLPPEFLEKIPAAVANAEQCRQHHKATGGKGNPSTEVDRLVRGLNAASRDTYHFNLSTAP